MKILNNQNYIANEKSRICSKHFEKNDLYKLNPTSKRKIRLGAVPTKFMIYSEDERYFFYSATTKIITVKQLSENVDILFDPQLMTYLSLLSSICDSKELKTYFDVDFSQAIHG